MHFPRTPQTFRCLALLLAVANLPACAQNPPPAPAPPAVAQKSSTMQLVIIPQRSEVISGESLPVQVTLTNTGSAPIEVPSPSSPSQLEYVFRSAADGKPVRTVSANSARLARSRDPVPPPPILLESVPPKEAVTYSEDLAGHSPMPIPPGQYQLTVVFGSGSNAVESAPAPLTVTVPRIRSLATVVGPSEQRLSLVYSHAEASGAMSLLQLESRTATAGDGTAYRRAEAPAASPLTGIATAVELDRNEGVRWFAWTDAQTLGAGVSQGRTLFKRIDPVPLNLRLPFLYPVGWQPDVNSALFAAIGYDARNQVALAIASVSARNPAQIKTVPLSFMKIPTRWVAQFQPSEGGGSIQIVAVEEFTGVTRLHRQTVVMGQETAAEPTMLRESPQLLAALALNPLGTADSGVVDALFGPRKDGEMTLVRVPLTGGQPVAEWKFTAPADAEQRRPTAWAIASTPQANPAIVAKLRDQLLVRRANGNDWTPLTPKAAQALQLRVEVIRDQPTVIWFDPVLGLQYRGIR